MSNPPDDPQKDYQQLAHDVLKSVDSGSESPPPGGIEEAWAEWSSHIQNVDERGMTLLRAAFEAGFEAGTSNN